MRLEHHLVGGYVRYISPYIIIIITHQLLNLLEEKKHFLLSYPSVYCPIFMPALLQAMDSNLLVRYKTHSFLSQDESTTHGIISQDD